MPGSELYGRFMALHARDGGLVMPNAWDGLSALMLAEHSPGNQNPQHIRGRGQSQ